MTLEGPERRSSPTTSAGDYFFDALPHGTYTVRVEFKNAPHLETPDPRTFSLGRDDTHPCAELTIIAKIKGVITGVVHDSNGQPLAGVFVQLALTDQVDLSRGRAGAGSVTDTQGRYTFTDLPPGRYQVGIRLWGNPMRPLWIRAYARTHDGRDVISLGLGERVTLIPLVARRARQMP